MRRVIKCQRTIVGRLQCGVDRETCVMEATVREALAETLTKAQSIVAQSGQRKSIDGQPKLYAWHAPEEFRVKVGIASTLNCNLIVGARAFHGNQYDGQRTAAG